MHLSLPFIFVSLFLFLYILAFLSLRLDLRTSLRRVSGPRQKRINLKTMSSLPNSPWPSPHRQRVSVWLVCFYYCCYHVVFHGNEQCLSLFFTSPTSLPSFSDSMSISILLFSFHQPLKVRISHTHTSI